MPTPREDIAFLANSPHRVAVLEMLVETPRSRDEIRHQIDASRVTITRVLRELEARTWIENSGQTYAMTPLGDWVCEEFTSLVDEVAAEHRLREVVQWFPSDLLTFEIQCLRDAEIILLDESDVTALVRRIIEFHRSGDRIRGIARESSPEFIENLWEITVHGDTRVEFVITSDIVDAIRTHPPTTRRFRETLEEEHVQYFVSDDIPISVGIVDDAVGINLIDDQGVLKGGVKTDNETVHAWAVNRFRNCRENASPVEPATFTP